MRFARYAVAMLSIPGVATLLACANRRPGTAEALLAHRGPVSANGTRNTLSPEELRRALGSNAFEIVQQLRPLFLRTRGPGPGPNVFVDNQRRGGVDQLRLIPAWEIAEIRYFDSRAATLLFGGAHSGGIIQILTPAMRSPRGLPEAATR